MSFRKYRYAKEYDKNADIPRSEIYNILKETWRITPSKNNFMPYSVYLLGTDKQDLKDAAYKLCIKNESSSNGIENIDILRDYETDKPQYWNITNCSYLLLFTPRVETELNPWQQDRSKNGNKFDQTQPHRMEGTFANRCIEIGMFSTIFASMCLEKDIDISHTMCIPSNLEDWHKSGFDFLEYAPILLMTAGKGIKYRLPSINEIENLDFKPDFTKIVNFLK